MAGFEHRPQELQYKVKNLCTVERDGKLKKINKKGESTDGKSTGFLHYLNN